MTINASATAPAAENTSAAKTIEVLHLIDTYRTGGPGKTIINSARFIDSTRYRVHVGSFTSADHRRNEFAAAVRRAGIPYLELRESGQGNVGHARLIRDYVRRHRIDILHTHGYRTDVLGYLAIRGMPVKIVTTHHGWIRNSYKAELLARGALFLSQYLDGVEVVSAKLCEELPAKLRRSKRAVVVHNGIVLDDYRAAGHRQAIRNELGLLATDRVIGVVGRLSIEKGVLEMIDAFSQVAKRLPGAHLLFVGEGPLESELRKRIDSFDLTGLVHFAGHRASVQPFFEALDLVASPSRTEGLSNVILEAFAMHRPVVATRVGGNTEILQTEVSGILVEPQRPAELAEAILSVLADDTLRCRLVAGGIERVLAFSFDVRMRREERFYDDVLEQTI